MRTIVIFILLLLEISITYSQTIKFQKVYGGGGADWGKYVEQTPDGGYIITGYSDSFGGGDRGYTIKTDSIGDTLWTKVYGILAGGNIDVYLVSGQQTVDGGFAFFGTSFKPPATDYNICLIKTNSNGDTLWTKNYGDTNDELAASGKQTNDGGYIIAGSTSSFGGDVYLIKTNSNGDTTWARTYGGTLADQGNTVQQTTDGGYIIIGTTNSFGAGDQDVYLIKTDANGDTLWTKTYGGIYEENGNSGQQTADGGYIITGRTKSFGMASSNVYLIKTNSIGDTLWTKSISGVNTAGAIGNSIRQITDNGYIITGLHSPNTSPFYNDAYLVKTNSNGDTLWTKAFGGAQDEEGFCVQQTSDKGYVLVGSTDSYGPSLTNVYLVKTDSMGNTNTYDGIIEQQHKKFQIKIYPNPFTTQAHLNLPEEINLSGQPELIIYDLYGNEVSRWAVSSRKATIEKGNLNAGMYFCNIVVSNMVIATGKFIIQ